MLKKSLSPLIGLVFLFNHLDADELCLSPAYKALSNATLAQNNITSRKKILKNESTHSGSGIKTFSDLFTNREIIAITPTPPIIAPAPTEAIPYIIGFSPDSKFFTVNQSIDPTGETNVAVYNIRKQKPPDIITLQQTPQPGDSLCQIIDPDLQIWNDDTIWPPPEKVSGYWPFVDISIVWRKSKDPKGMLTTDIVLREDSSGIKKELKITPLLKTWDFIGAFVSPDSRFLSLVFRKSTNDYNIFEPLFFDVWSEVSSLYLLIGKQKSDSHDYYKSFKYYTMSSALDTNDTEAASKASIAAALNNDMQQVNTYLKHCKSIMNKTTFQNHLQSDFFKHYRNELWFKELLTAE